MCYLLVANDDLLFLTTVFILDILEEEQGHFYEACRVVLLEPNLEEMVMASDSIPLSDRGGVSEPKALHYQALVKELEAHLGYLVQFKLWL